MPRKGCGKCDGDVQNNDVSLTTTEFRMGSTLSDDEREESIMLTNDRLLLAHT